MPTAKVISGAGAKGAIEYILQKNKKNVFEKPTLLIQNLCFGKPNEIAYQMHALAEDRPNVKKPFLHTTIQFHPEEKISEEKGLKVIKKVLEEMGLRDDCHQYVVARHQDKEHDHYHIVLNRVGMDDSLIKNENINYKMQVICDKIEKEMDLRPTENRLFIYDPKSATGYRKNPEHKKTSPQKTNKEGIEEKKDLVRKEIRSILKTAKSPEELKQKLSLKNIEVTYKIQATGIVGASFRLSPHDQEPISFKGKDLEYKWGTIQKILDSNQVKSEIDPGALRQMQREFRYLDNMPFIIFEDILKAIPKGSILSSSKNGEYSINYQNHLIPFTALNPRFSKAYFEKKFLNPDDGEHQTQKKEDIIKLIGQICAKAKNSATLTDQVLETMALYGIKMSTKQGSSDRFFKVKSHPPEVSLSELIQKGILPRVLFIDDKGVKSLVDRKGLEIMQKKDSDYKPLSGKDIKTVETLLYADKTAIHQRARFTNIPELPPALKKDYSIEINHFETAREFIRDIRNINKLIAFSEIKGYSIRPEDYILSMNKMDIALNFSWSQEGIKEISVFSPENENYTLSLKDIAPELDARIKECLEEMDFKTMDDFCRSVNLQDGMIREYTEEEQAFYEACFRDNGYAIHKNRGEREILSSLEYEFFEETSEYFNGGIGSMPVHENHYKPYYPGDGLAELFADIAKVASQSQPVSMREDPVLSKRKKKLNRKNISGPSPTPPKRTIQKP